MKPPQSASVESLPLLSDVPVSYLSVMVSIAVARVSVKMVRSASNSFSIAFLVFSSSFLIRSFRYVCVLNSRRLYSLPGLVVAPQNTSIPPDITTREVAQ